MTHLPLRIDPRHPAFAGHFPDRPIVPGVVLLDESLRAIARHRGGDRATTAAGYRIGAAKFLSIVTPGEPVRLEIDASDAASASDRCSLRLFAGQREHERLALTASIAFDSGVDSAVDDGLDVAVPSLPDSA